MKIALVFEDTSHIWCEVLSLAINIDFIELSLFQGRKEAPKVELGNFVRVYERKDFKEWPLIFEGYVSQCDKDKIRIEKHYD